MSKIDDGGPAYPQTTESWYRTEVGDPAPSGMSLRDWFAGQALAAMDLEERITESCARNAYWIADAMLAERLKSSAPSAHQEEGR